MRQHGLVTVGADKYYLKSGVMQKGLQTIDGKLYYFLSDGKMAVGTTIDGYTIGADGVVTKSPSETEDNSKTEDDPNGKGNGGKNAADGAERRQEPMRQLVRVAAGNGVEQENFQNFVFAQISAV